MSTRNHLARADAFEPEKRITYRTPPACQRRLKIRPKGGAKDCHLGWWAELGVRLGFRDAVRGFFGGSGQRSHAELKRSAPASRPQGGMVCPVESDEFPCGEVVFSGGHASLAIEKHALIQ